MRTNVSILLIFCILGYALTWFFYHKKPLTPAPQEVADFSFTDIKGKTHRISDYKGKVVLLNFWASWCAPCIKEFPHLLQLAENNREDLVFIGLSSDMQEDVVHKFLKNQKNWQEKNVVIAIDSEGVTARLFGVVMLPETLVIGPDGLVQGKLIGADWSVDEVQKKINTGLLPGRY